MAQLTLTLRSSDFRVWPLVRSFEATTDFPSLRKQGSSHAWNHKNLGVILKHCHSRALPGREVRISDTSYDHQGVVRALHTSSVKLVLLRTFFFDKGASHSESRMKATIPECHSKFPVWLESLLFWTVPKAAQLWLIFSSWVCWHLTPNSFRLAGSQFFPFNQIPNEIITFRSMGLNTQLMLCKKLLWSLDHDFSGPHHTWK